MSARFSGVMHMADAELDIPELKSEFVFTRRPAAIPADLRLGWRIGLLVLLLSKCCRAGRTTLARLHVHSWAIRNKANKDNLSAVIAGDIPPDALLVRVEPSLSRAVEFAIGEGLVQRIGGRQIALTAMGR